MKNVRPRVGQWWIKTTGILGVYQTYYVVGVTRKKGLGSEVIAYTASSEFPSDCGYSWLGSIERFLSEFEFLGDWPILT